MVVIEGKIKGKARPRFNTKTGRAFTLGDTVSYENWVRLCYKEQDGRYLEGSLKAVITAYYEIPKSYTKKRVQAIKEGLELPIKKPDADNIAKIILDSLNGIAYKDDSQIVNLTVIKKYTDAAEKVMLELEGM